MAKFKSKKTTIFSKRKTFKTINLTNPNYLPYSNELVLYKDKYVLGTKENLNLRPLKVNLVVLTQKDLKKVNKLKKYWSNTRVK